MANTNAPQCAYMCVEESKHKYIAQASLSKVQKWFDASADTILEHYNKGSKGLNLAKKDIILGEHPVAYIDCYVYQTHFLLVTGTLSAQKYGLMVAHEKIDAQVCPLNTRICALLIVYPLDLFQSVCPIERFKQI